MHRRFTVAHSLTLRAAQHHSRPLRSQAVPVVQPGLQHWVQEVHRSKRVGTQFACPRALLWPWSCISSTPQHVDLVLFALVCLCSDTLSLAPLSARSIARSLVVARRLFVNSTRFSLKCSTSDIIFLSLLYVCHTVDQTLVHAVVRRAHPVVHSNAQRLT
jgi:hypothetical protein